MSFKKFTAALSTLAIVMTSVFTFGVVASAATTFTDASNISSWAVASANALVEAGVISGRPNGSFDPKGNLNRAEMAKIATLGAGLATDTTGAPHFNDVSVNDWFYFYVETLYNNGVVGGINGGALDANGMATYNPAGTLNRAEGAKILVDAFDLETAYAGTPANFPDVAKGAWFFDYVETAYAHGLLNGYDNGNFGPSDAVTREQIAVIAQASREEAGLVSGIAAGSKRRSTYTAGAASTVAVDTTPDTPVVGASDGTINVALSASTPAAQTFPAGASSTAVAAYNFTASSAGAVVISNLTIKRTGVGTDSDWTLYLYDGANRLTSGKTINSTSHEATFTGVNLTVAAGTTKTLTLKADTPATGAQGGDSYFEISSASAVSSNAAGITGSFPVKSNKQEINANVTAGSITITTNGTVTNPKVGEDDATIAKFKLQTANEAGLIKQIAFIVDGTVSATDVQNAKLYQGTTLLATAANVNSKDLLVFNLATPFEIAKGDSRNFEVKADLNTGRAGDTLEVYLDETTDLVSTGGTYGFGMSVVDAGYDGTTGNLSTSTLQGGDITISSNGPAATQIAVNGKDVVLMNFNITTVAETTFKKFAIGLTATGEGLLSAASTAAYTDIKIINKDTGAAIMGPIDSNVMKDALGGTTIVDTTTDMAIAYHIFQDEFTMTAGQSLNLALTADVANVAALNADTLVAQVVTNANYPEMKNLNNKTVVNADSLVPATPIDGKTMTVAAASLTVALASTPVSKTFVKGNKNVCFAGFSLSAGDASDAKITELKVNASHDADGVGYTATYSATKDIVGSAKLMDGSTQIGSIKSMQTSATAAYLTFDNLNYTIPAGGTKLLQVCGDISSSLSTNKAVAFGIIDVANVTAEDKDGNSVTITGTANSVTAPTVAMIISQGGTLTIAADADTAKANIVVAGTSDVAVSKFRFSAADEAFLVKKLELKNTGTAANVTSVKISYTNSAGATETKTGYLTANKVSFSGLDMLIPADDDANLSVSVNLTTIASGATAGSNVNFDISDDGTDPLNFEAVAQGSGETYIGTNARLTYVAATVSAATNAMDVYETKPTVTLSATSPSGSRTTAASDGIFRFTVAADSMEKVQLRAAVQNVADTTASWAAVDSTPGGEVISADTTVKVEGAASVKATPSAGHTLASVTYTAAVGDLTNYARVSFWARSDGAATTAQANFVVTDATLTDTKAFSTALVADTWTFQDIALTAATTTNRDAVTAYGVTITGGLAADEVFYIDDIKFYNEKIKVDLASDAKLAAANAANGLVAYLKEGGSTVATGYINQTSTSAATVTFIPTVAIEIAKGTSKTFTVETATTTLLATTGNDDLLTASITLGSSTSDGNFWWNDTNETVKWLGQVDNTTLNGNTLKY